MEADQAKADIFGFLENWPGHGPIADSMHDNPGVDFFVAGGIVRDAFLGKLPQSRDIDIFMQGSGCEDIAEGLAQHGSLEIGSFGAYEWTPRDGNAVSCDVVLVHRFYNGLWHCRDMLDALNQFDCTVNALALDLRTGALMNPQNGRHDIALKIMRAVRFDYPDEPISKGASLTRNAVLWWRLLHYASLLDLEIEHVTLRWLVRNRAYESCREDFEQSFHLVEDAALLLLDS